jgi:superoxide reductase
MSEEKKEFSLTEINRASYPLNDMVRKHLPIITTPGDVKKGKPFEVKIKVGGIDGVEHPNMLGHWINYVELFAGEIPIAKVEFAPVVTEQYEVTIKLVLEEKAMLKAFAFCNLHGLWESEQEDVIVY